MKKVRKIENKILDFIETHQVLFFLLFFTIAALLVRYCLFSVESGDFKVFLKPWFEELKANGGFKALANFPGDYNAPYMTLLALLTYLPINPLYSIKTLSVLGDFLLAFSSYQLVNTLMQGKEKQKFYALLAYIVVLFLPQVILNGSCWGQCDAIYTSFILLSFHYLLKEKYTTSFILLGISFAFKLQFIFILPFFLILYVLERKFSIFHFLIIPIVNLIMCLPAIIMGKPFLDCMTIYFRQSSAQSDMLTRNFINIYQIFQADATVFTKAGILFTISICAMILFYFWHKKIELNPEKKLLLATWLIILLTYFMPAMHERYLFVGEILGVLYYLCYRKHGLIIGIITINALITYTFFLYHYPFSINYFWIAIPELIFFGIATKKIIEDFEKK